MFFYSSDRCPCKSWRNFHHEKKSMLTKEPVFVFGGQIRYLDEYLDDLTSIKKNLGLIQAPFWQLWVGHWLDTVSHKKRRCVYFMWTWHVNSLFTKVRGFIVWGWLPSVSGRIPRFSMFFDAADLRFRCNRNQGREIQSSWHPHSLQMKALRVASEVRFHEIINTIWCMMIGWVLAKDWCLVQILEDLMPFHSKQELILLECFGYVFTFLGTNQIQKLLGC